MRELIASRVRREFVVGFFGGDGGRPEPGDDAEDPDDDQAAGKAGEQGRHDVPPNGRAWR